MAIEKEEAVANTSSLIFLAKIGALYLAKKLFTHFLVPEEVAQEILEKDTAEVVLLQEEFSSFLKKVPVKNTLMMPLGIGERAAISYCLEEKIFFFLSDDLAARSYAHSLNIKTIGVIGILLTSFKRKIITKNEFLDFFEKLHNANYYMSHQLYAEVMKEIDR